MSRIKFTREYTESETKAIEVWSKALMNEINKTSIFFRYLDEQNKKVASEDFETLKKVVRELK